MTDPARPTLRLLHHLARTGGTLISKCIGSMDGVVLLSEIHPAGSPFPNMNPLYQAHEWFGLLTADDLAMVQRRDKLPFVEAIALIHTRAAERGKLLVIRDWTHLDFTGVPFVRNPSYALRLAAVLRPAFDLRQAVTVRHPIDQWLSFVRLASMRNITVDLQLFLHGCRRFAELCPALGFVRYEDFVADPEASLRRLCDALALPYDPGFRQRWADYAFITGDVGARGAAIGTKPRPPVEPALLDAFAANADYRRAIELLGYAHPA